MIPAAFSGYVSLTAPRITDAFLLTEAWASLRDGHIMLVSDRPDLDLFTEDWEEQESSQLSRAAWDDIHTKRFEAAIQTCDGLGSILAHCNSSAGMSTKNDRMPSHD